MNILTFINMHLNELQNAVIQNVATDPTTGNKKGRIIFNSSENTFKYWNGTEWIAPSSSGGGGQPGETVTVPNGGTGATSFTAGEVLIGNGTDPITSIAIDSEVTSDSTNLITSGAVDTFVNAAIAAALGTIESMKFMGTVSATGVITSGDTTINNSNITALTSYKTGWTFKASAAIPLSVLNIGGIAIETGDMIICISDAEAYSSSIFSVIQTNIDGSVSGPTGTVTNGALVAFDGTTGKVIKQLTDSEGTAITAEYLNAKFSNVFTINTDSDVLLEGESQIVTQGDTIKLILANTGVTAGVYGDNSTLDSINNGDTIKIPQVTVDSKGRVTSAVEKELEVTISAAKRVSGTNPTLTPNSGVCTWTFEHNLNCQYPTVSIYEISTGQIVVAEVTSTNANTSTISILTTSEIAAGTYTCSVCG